MKKLKSLEILLYSSKAISVYTYTASEHTSR